MWHFKLKVVQIEEESVENAAAYSLLPWIKNKIFSKAYVIAIGCIKGKYENLIVPSSELYIIYGWSWEILATKKV